MLRLFINGKRDFGAVGVPLERKDMVGNDLYSGDRVDIYMRQNGELKKFISGEYLFGDATNTWISLPSNCRYLLEDESDDMVPHLLRVAPYTNIKAGKCLEGIRGCLIVAKEVTDEEQA